ncbi:MAG: hypothetical protein ACYTAF_10655 [Planctomycetota bacterium]|jgi:hypothetical protein
MRPSAALVPIGVGLCVVLISAILFYCRQNDSGHTGLDPYHALAFFVPLAAAGAAHFVYSLRKGEGKLAGLIALVTGLAGVALLVYLDVSNTLLPYEVWIRRGMP